MDHIWSSSISKNTRKSQQINVFKTVYKLILVLQQYLVNPGFANRSWKVIYLSYYNLKIPDLPLLFITLHRRKKYAA